MSNLCVCSLLTVNVQRFPFSLKDSLSLHHRANEDAAKFSTLHSQKAFIKPHFCKTKPQFLLSA